MSRPSAPQKHKSSTDSVPHLPTNPENLIVPEGAVDSDVAELLAEFIEPHSQSRNESEGEVVVTETAVDEDSDEEDERRELRSLPWWKRPSPWWLMMMMPLSAIALSATIAPRVQIYTKLACAELKPDYTVIIRDPHFGHSPGPVLSPSSLVHTSHNLGLSRFAFTWAPNDLDHETTIPEPSRECAADPEVQQAVATLSAAMTTIGGIFSCLTGVWWASLSDRYGRTFLLGLSVIGVFATDLTFIVVSFFSKQLPGGYRFLLLAPIIDGIMGGMPTAVAAIHAYITDTTTPANRARMLSLSLGLLFSGMAVGPSIGSLLISWTSDLLSTFYLAFACHIFYGCMVWFIIPESLSKKTRNENIRRKTLESEGQEGGLRKLFAFLTPLTVFLPREREAGDPSRGKDWNLTFLCLSYGAAILIMASYTYKFQFAAAQFGWDSEQLGYWFSAIGVARATHLIIVLPTVIKFLRPSPPPIALPTSPSEPLSGDPDTSRPRAHNPRFDLGIARVSLLIDFTCYIATALSRTPISWTIATLIGAFGGGYSPAAQSLAVELSRGGGRDAGRVFGALGVVQALCSQIIGPSLFGFTYVQTVATFPQAIFVLAAVAVATSFTFLSLIRIPRHRTDDMENSSSAAST